MSKYHLLPDPQKLSACGYSISKLTTDEKEQVVWEMIREETLAGRLMFEMMQFKLIGPGTALEILLGVIKESQRDHHN